MKKTKLITRNVSIVLLSILTLSSIVLSCRKTELVTTTSDDANAYSYLKKFPERFSLFAKVLELSDNAGFLNAYGDYTVFVPENNAITTYLQEHNIANLEAIAKSDLNDLVRLHVIQDTLTTTDFTDGKIGSVTMFGQFLVSGAANVNGVTRYTINRSAQIVQSDIRVGNGILQVIDKVIEPARLNVAEIIAANPNYSIFTEALRATGLYDTLMLAPSAVPEIRKQFKTVLVESNEVLSQAGINSYQDLYNKYSDKKNPTSKTDSLNIYIRYHILEDAKYLGDIVSSQTHSTFAPLEILTAKLKGQIVLINDDIYNNVHEIGFQLNRASSDITALNGVVHDAMGHFNVKVRRPFPIYWDLADFPEMTRLSAYYGKADYTFPQELAENLEDIKFQSVPRGGNSMIYKYASSGGAGTSYKRDVLMVPMGAVSRSNWVDFRSPVLVRGTYKVWVCYFRQQQSSSNRVHRYQISIGDQVMPRQVDFGSGMPDPRSNTPDALEALNYKSYMLNNTASSSQYQVGRCVGILTVEATGRVWVRFTALPGTAGGTNSQNTNNLDMIQFIPVEMEQQFPVFDPLGVSYMSRN